VPAALQAEPATMRHAEVPAALQAEPATMRHAEVPAALQAEPATALQARRTQGSPVRGGGCAGARCRWR
jgi:hypothetical protein